MKPPIAVAYDVETTGLSRRKHKVFSYSLCDVNENITIRRFDGAASRVAMAEHRFTKLWEDTSIIKVAHNAKFDIGFTEAKLGRHIPDHTIHCTYLMSKILRNNHYTHALDDLAWELMGYSKSDDRAIRPYTRGGGCYQDVPEDLMYAYQKADAERGMLLWLFFSQKIWADKNLLEMYDFERKNLHVTLRTEDTGLMINPDTANKIITQTQVKVQRALDSIQRIAGRRLKPGTAQFRDYIYKDLNLPVLAKTASGLPSTRKLVMDELYKLVQHPILIAARAYSSYSHSVSTIRGYLERRDDGNVIHPTINPCEAETLREACRDPNLQNTKRPEAGDDNPYYVPARECFEPEPGYVFFFVDYDGQEARVLVQYSQDKIALDIIHDRGDAAKKFSRKGKGDFHTLGACLWYGMDYLKAEGQHQKDLRTRGKNTSFGKAYGGQADKLAVVAGLDLDGVKAGIKRFEDVLPNLSGLCRTMARQVRECGYVTSIFGNRLYVPRNEAYKGVNAVVQHTGTQMIKRSKVKVHEYLQKATGGEVKIAMSIHDELMFKFPRKMLSEAKHIFRNIRERMIDFGGRFSVPVEIEVSVATTNWAEKKEFSIKD